MIHDIIIAAASSGTAGSSIPVSGYIGGGWLSSSSYRLTIDGFRFATETVIRLSSTLVSARAPAGANSLSRGYFAGGFTGIYTGEIDGIQFSDESSINPTASIGARSNLAAVNSTTAAYFGGGYSSDTATDAIYGFTFSSESIFYPSATLSVARYGHAGVSSSTRGYFGGGYATSTINEVDGLRFDTGAAINPSATVGALYYVSGLNSSTTGYFGGGEGSTTTPSSNGIISLTFTTETTTVLGVGLTMGRHGAAGVNSATTGYFCGGSYNWYEGVSWSPTWYDTSVSEIDGIQFSTNTITNPAASLVGPTGRLVGGVQSGGML